LVAAICLGTNSSAAATFPLRWRWSNPAPHGNNVIEMAYSSSLGLAVQVAERGQIYTSDGLDFWTPRDSFTTNALRSVTFFGGRIIVTGENGTALHADSVTDFRAATVNPVTTDWFEGVTAGPGLLVAVGDNAAIYTSATGTNWARQAVGFTDWLRSAAYGGGNFVAVGEAGTVAHSANGTNWSKVLSGTSVNLNKVIFISGRFMAVGDDGTSIYSTNSGVTWFPESSGATNTLNTAAGIVNSTLVFAGESEVRLFDTLLWTSQLGGSNSPPAWNYLSAIAQTNYFLLAGQTGMLVAGSKTNLSPFAWSTTTDSVRNWLWDALRLTNFYATVGDHATVMTSGDGVTWSLELVPDAVTNSIFLGVGGNTNLLVAVGDQGSIIFSTNAYVPIVTTNGTGTNATFTTNLVSQLGIVWSAVSPRPTTNDLQGVAVLNDLFIVAGNNGTILTSADGTNWTVRSTPGAAVLSGVAAFPGGAVAVGDDGAILNSADGISWTVLPPFTTNWVYRVRYLNGQLVAVGQNGTILTSANGTNWTSRTSDTTKWLSDVTCLDNTWFIVGTQGTLLASTNNAVTWTSLGTITGKSLYAAANDGAQLIALGVEGVILRSQVVPLTNAVNVVGYARSSYPANGTYQNLFLVNGKTDQRFTLDILGNIGATNSWFTGPLLEITDPNGSLYYLETGSLSNAPAREFYRTKLVP
jgi:hypothetical protein